MEKNVDIFITDDLTARVGFFGMIEIASKMEDVIISIERDEVPALIKFLHGYIEFVALAPDRN